MLKFYLGLLGKVPGTLSTAFDRWISITSLVIFFLTLFNEPFGQFVGARWQAISPWWSVLPVGLLFFYGMMKTNYESYQALLQRLGPEPSQRAIDILLATYEGLQDGSGTIMILGTNMVPFVRAGHIDFFAAAPGETAEYKAEIELLFEGQWITHGSSNNPDYYELAAKGLKKAGEVFSSSEGKKLLAEICQKFRYR